MQNMYQLLYGKMEKQKDEKLPNHYLCKGVKRTKRCKIFDTFYDVNIYTMVFSNIL